MQGRGLARRQEREAATIQAAHERLPQDETFIALACEARPRITALRLRAHDLLQDVGSVTGGRVDQAVREFAAQVKAAQRSRRKGETVAHGMAPAGEETR